jgi:hypothetical protein
LIFRDTIICLAVCFRMVKGQPTALAAAAAQ